MEENTYYKLNEDEKKKIELASNITMTEYNLDGNFISTYSMLCVIEDLLMEVDRLEEKITDIRNGFDY